jgi:hypothetical protein
MCSFFEGVSMRMNFSSVDMANFDLRHTNDDEPMIST